MKTETSAYDNDMWTDSSTSLHPRLGIKTEYRSQAMGYPTVFSHYAISSHRLTVARNQYGVHYEG